MARTYFVYILTNRHNNVLYTGVTNDIAERLQQHQDGDGSKFTRRYKMPKLVYLETFDSIHQAIDWEKTIKAGSRQKKIELINEQNPGWLDLSESL